MSEGWQAALTILGLAAMTLVTRVFFLLPERPPPIPPWLLRGLQVAPLAALAAVVAPEVLTSGGHLITTWRDARWPAAIVAAVYHRWRPGVLGPLLAGLAVYLPLHLLAGW